VWRNNGKCVVPVDPVVHRHAGNATPRINGLRLTPQRLIKFEAAKKKGCPVSERRAVSHAEALFIGHGNEA
jgi:hypothetical protein